MIGATPVSRAFDGAKDTSEACTQSVNRQDQLFQLAFNFNLSLKVDLQDNE